MKIHFLNVGHGDMSIVEIAGKTILVDLNICEDNDAKEYLESALSSKEIDYLILTHPHEDHVRGLEKLIEEGYTFNKVYESGYRYPETMSFKDKFEKDEYIFVKKYLDKNEDKNVIQLKPSMEKINSDEEFDIYCYNSKTDDNEDIHYSSLVIKISENGKSVLFTGDSNLQAWEEKIIKKYSDCISCDILHASHHGSRTFFMVNKDEDCYTEHISKISPTYTIISAPNEDKKRDDWPPHEEAVEQYKKYTSVDGGVYVTGEKDTLVFNLDSDGIEVTEPDTQSVKYKFHEGKFIEKSIRFENNFFMSEAVTNPIKIFDVSHRKKPEWNVRKTYQVTIQATYKTKNGKTKVYKNNGFPIPKKSMIKFTAKTSAPKPYDLKWQILNTGKEAEKHGLSALRGEFYDSTGDNYRMEPTAYKGKHMAQAYVIQNGICVGISNEFVVNIQ